MTRQQVFKMLDSYVHLAALMIKCSGGQDSQTKIDLLKKVCVCHYLYSLLFRRKL